MFEVLFETTDPYPGQYASVNLAVAGDPLYRPQIPMDTEWERYMVSAENEVFETLGKKKEAFEKIVELMKRCYAHETNKRPNFVEIENEILRIEELVFQK